MLIAPPFLSGLELIVLDGGGHGAVLSPIHGHRVGAGACPGMRSTLARRGTSAPFRPHAPSTIHRGAFECPLAGLSFGIVAAYFSAGCPIAQGGVATASPFFGTVEVVTGHRAFSPLTPDLPVGIA